MGKGFENDEDGEYTDGLSIFKPIRISEKFVRPKTPPETKNFLLRIQERQKANQKDSICDETILVNSKENIESKTQDPDVGEQSQNSNIQSKALSNTLITSTQNTMSQLDVVQFHTCLSPIINQSENTNNILITDSIIINDSFIENSPIPITNLQQQQQQQQQQTSSSKYRLINPNVGDSPMEELIVPQIKKTSHLFNEIHHNNHSQSKKCKRKSSITNTNHNHTNKRLSIGTPLTPDILLNFVSSTHSSKSCQDTVKKSNPQIVDNNNKLTANVPEKQIKMSKLLMNQKKTTKLLSNLQNSPSITPKSILREVNQNTNTTNTTNNNNSSKIKSKQILSTIKRTPVLKQSKQLTPKKKQFNDKNVTTTNTTNNNNSSKIKSKQILSTIKRTPVLKQSKQPTPNKKQFSDKNVTTTTTTNTTTNNNNSSKIKSKQILSTIKRTPVLKQSKQLTPKNKQFNDKNVTEKKTNNNDNQKSKTTDQQPTNNVSIPPRRKSNRLLLLSSGTSTSQPIYVRPLSNVDLDATINNPCLKKSKSLLNYKQQIKKSTTQQTSMISSSPIEKNLTKELLLPNNNNHKRKSHVNEITTPLLLLLTKTKRLSVSQIKVNEDSLILTANNESLFNCFSENYYLRCLLETINKRSSLEEFQSTPLTQRKDVSIKSPLASEIGATRISIVFSGTQSEEEQVLIALLKSSNLIGYDLVKLPHSHTHSHSHATRTKCQLGTANRSFSLVQFTHLITESPCRRTLKLFHALIRGVHIVTTDWLRQSVTANMWLSELEFKPPGLPRLSRMQKMNKLFANVGILYVGPDTKPPRQDLVDLLNLGGAILTNKKTEATILIGCHLCNKTCIKPSWILDSIFQAKLLPLTDYDLSTDHH
ncbi:unnamed protein product [Schistosoma turkestanicum]|nr:unnamed protein product [Schistosoma turkestanicum]